ncbi:MAG: hypothetical protein RL090_393 [Bacteroidota bacterium]|jgi:hypothetical protein
MAEFDSNDQQSDLFAKAVRAGKRTYFFDVRSTRNNDHYLTITESKRRFADGSDRPFFEKHKIFLYKEDFEKFVDGLQEAIDYIKTNFPESQTREYNRDENNTGSQDSSGSSSYTDIDFDDLGK